MFSVFKNINRFAGKSKLLDVFAIFCARLLPYLLVIFLFFYSIWAANFYLFVLAVLSGLSARFVINELVYLFYKEQRPALTEKTKTLIPVPKNYSFPSGHSSFFFGISFFLFFNDFYLGATFIALSFMVGVARVFCGVHWFRDILGGCAAGLLSALVIHYLSIII